MYYGLTNSLGRNFMGSRGFNPLSLSPAIWLDASDASTLYDATVGGSLVAANGAIARWEDKSGNARHATQSTGVSQPLRKTSIQNGKDVVRLDGANDFFTIPAEITPTAVTIFIVQDTTGDSMFLSPQADNRQIRIGQGGGNVLSTYDGAANPQSTALTVARGTCSLVLYKKSGSTVSFYENGAAKGTGTNNDIKIGTLFAGAGGGGDFINGDISELLIYPTALADADREAVETYLNSKWAIY